MEVVIKVNTWADIEVLLPIFERLGITLPQQQEKIKQVQSPVLPITFAEKADFKALAGIWKDKPIDADALRKAVWGNRL